MRYRTEGGLSLLRGLRRTDLRGIQQLYSYATTNFRCSASSPNTGRKSRRAVGFFLLFVLVVGVVVVALNSSGGSAAGGHSSGSESASLVLPSDESAFGIDAQPKANAPICIHGEEEFHTIFPAEFLSSPV